MSVALRAGIVGFGGMGQRHYRAYEGTPCEVAAICEWRPERVGEVLPDFPRDRVYSDYRDLLAKESLDVLSVVSNGPTHAEIVIAAAEAGIPRIVCEKPAATSLRDADRALEAVSRTKARVSVNHIRRWSPAYHRLRDAIREGAIGDLRHLYFHIGSVGLGNYVIHIFDLMRFLSGSEPAWAMGALDRTGTPNPRGAQYEDPAGFGVVVFENGMRGYVESCEDTGVQYLIVLAGRYGRIVIDELNASWRLEARAEKDRSAPLTRYGTPMERRPFDGGDFDIVELTRSGILELLGTGELSCALEDGMKSLEMVIAFHESEALGNARLDFPLSRKARERVVHIA